MSPPRAALGRTNGLLILQAMEPMGLRRIIILIPVQQNFRVDLKTGIQNFKISFKQNKQFQKLLELIVIILINMFKPKVLRMN